MKNEDYKTLKKYWTQKFEIEDIDNFYKSYSGIAVLRAFNKLLPNIYNGKKLLDVGCGIGRYFKFFSEKKEFTELLGIEINSRLARICKTLNPDCQVLIASMSNLPFKNNAIDVIISMGLIEHFRDPLPLLKELVRALRSGGILLLETPNKLNLVHVLYKLIRIKSIAWEHWWSPKDLIKLVKNIPHLEYKEYVTAIFFAWKSSWIPAILKRFRVSYEKIIRFEEKFLGICGHLMFIKTVKKAQEIQSRS